MNGGLTLQELELLKRKAKARDSALEFIRGRAYSEEAQEMQRILQQADEQ